jgi:hypothetical protein
VRHGLCAQDGREQKRTWLLAIAQYFVTLKVYLSAGWACHQLAGKCSNRRTWRGSGNISTVIRQAMTAIPAGRLRLSCGPHLWQMVGN